MKALYFVRHGQSEANARGIYAGQSPHVQLTDAGRAQARAAATGLRSAGITHIIASDLDRAKETAKIIAGELALPAAALTTDGRLREVAVGQLTGQPDRGYDHYLRYMSSGSDPDAETPDEVSRRVGAFVADLAGCDDTVLIVAHAGIGRVLRTILEGVALDDPSQQSIANAVPMQLSVARLPQGETL